MEDSAYLEPTANSRWTVAALVLLGLAFVAVVDLYWPRLSAHIDSLPLCDQLPWTRAILLSFFSLSPLTAFVLIRHGRKIRASGQVPPPDALVFFRTPIKRGRTALLHAYSSYAIAICAIAVPLYFLAKAWPTVSLLFMSVAQCKSGGT